MLGAIPWLLLGLPSVSAGVAEFFNPGPPPYPTWEVGERQTIRYKTSYTEYTIALWQQLDNAGSLGPILFQTTNGPDHEFEWLVQNYNLDLGISDKFFLWLFEGPPSRQGNFSFNQQSSGFFTIVDEGTTTTTTEAATTATTTATETTSSVPSASVQFPSSSLTVPLEQTTTSGTSETSSSDAENSQGDGELSVGAKAGIGAGAGVAGVALIAAVLFFFKYRSNKRKLEEMQQQATAYSYQPYLYPGGPAATDMSKTPPPPAQPPSELGNYNRPAVEIG